MNDNGNDSSDCFRGAGLMLTRKSTPGSKRTIPMTHWKEALDVELHRDYVSGTQSRPRPKQPTCPQVATPTPMHSWSTLLDS